MKRTRETINYQHPAERWNISGALGFDGEDNDEAARKRRNQQLQKEWLLEQQAEKKRMQEMERQHDL